MSFTGGDVCCGTGESRCGSVGDDLGRIVAVSSCDCNGLPRVVFCDNRKNLAVIDLRFENPVDEAGLGSGLRDRGLTKTRAKDMRRERRDLSVGLAKLDV